MYAIEINQRNTFPPSFANQQDIIRADIQMQVTGLVEGFQHIQDRGHPAHMGGQRNGLLALPA